MNLKSIISLLNPISFWRMDKYGGDNIYDDYSNNTLINHNCILGEDGSTNSNLGDKSTNIRGGYLDHTDTGFLNDLVANQLLHISFNFKCPEKIVGIKPIVSKWFPENQWFLGFENGILVGKVQTDYGLVEVQIDNDYVLYNNRWNHCSFMIYNDELRIDVNGNSQYISGVTVKNITNIPVIGINSPFLIGGKDSYTMTQDFYITDLAITQKSTNTLNNDIKPLYVLTRDVEERFLDLAPDYYFNIAESFERGEGLTIRNKGTLGNHIYGYLAGSDIENFSLVEDVKDNNEKRVLMPNHTYFVISDILELNLVGVDTTNVLFDYNMPKLVWKSGDRQWYPSSFSNPSSSYRLFRKHFFDYYSSDWVVRFYTYSYNENGTRLQDSSTSSGARDNPDELEAYYSGNGIYWDNLSVQGSNSFKLQRNTNDTNTFTRSQDNLSSSYSPAVNQSFESNYFFNVSSIADLTLMSLGKMALIKRKLNSYEVAQLRAPEPYILYNLLKNYGQYSGWLSCVTTRDKMRRLYNHDGMRFDYYSGNVEFFKHNDPNTNRLNNWNATYRGVIGTDGYLKTYRSTMLSTRNFIWNFFAESITTDTPYVLMRYRNYTGALEPFITFYANSLNGEYSPGNIEVRFETTFNGSFSTTTPKLNLGGYHMITLTRNEDYYELYIDGILESYFSTGYTHDIDGTYSADFLVNFLDTHYMNDISIISGDSPGVVGDEYDLDPDDYKAMIEFMFQGYHHKITGTSYLQGVPIQSNLHTIESDSLAKIQTNLTDTSGNFSFNLPKSANSTGKYLLSLPVDENATSNVVVHGPYQTSVTYGQISEEPLVGEEVYDMTLDFEPLIFYPTNETVLPILDNSGNSHDAIGFTGSDYILDEPAFEDQSTSINLHSGTTYLEIPSTGLLIDISTGLTINLWVKKNISQTYTPLFHFGSTTVNTNDMITLYQDEALNTWVFTVGDGTTKSITGGLTVGSWTMITLRINPDNTYDFFIGGKVFKHDVCGASAVIDRVVGRIGHVATNNENNDANISNFSIFNYPLPNEELEKMANKGKGHNSNTLKSAIMYDNPMAYYTLDLRKQLTEEISNYDLTVNGSVDYNKNSAIINRDVVGNNYMFNTEYKLLPVNSGGSVEFGFKTTGNHTQSVLLSEWNDTIGEGSYKFQLEAGDILKCYVLDDRYYMESSALNQNEWHLVILTIVNGNIFNLYVDNVLQGSLTLDPLLPPISYETAVNNLTPLAYYRLGEIDGAIDETGNYNGTLSGDPTLGVSGLLYENSNNAIEFDGVDDLISVNNILLVNTFSISFLCNIQTFNQYNIIAHDDGYGLYFYNDKFSFYYSGSNHVFGSSLLVNTDYNIVIICEAGISKVYVNGILDPNEGVYNSNFNIKSLFGSISGELLNGTIDELSIYDKALTQSDVNSLYTSSVAPTYQDAVKNLTPLVYYRLGEFSNNIAYDEMGIENINIDDSFDGIDGADLNPDLWITSITNDPIVGISEIQNNQWYCKIDNQPATTSYINSISPNDLQGDFDLQLDFADADFGTSYDSYIGFLLQIDSSNYLNCLINGGDLIETRMVIGGSATYTRTARLNDFGQLRITRFGSDVKWYVNDGAIDNNWNEIYSQTWLSGDIGTFRIFMRNKDTNVTPISVNINNFIMNLGNAYRNNNGTYLNTPTLGVSGLLSSDSNTAVNLDGSTQSIDTGIKYTASANRTWGCLIKPDNVASSRQMIFGDMDIGATNASSRLVFGINGHAWYINIGDGSSYYVDESILHNMVQGITYHIIVVQDGLNYLVYVDSVLVHTFTSTVNANVNGVYKIHIGRVGEHSDFFFDGTLDEPFIIDSSLTQSDIDYLYQIANLSQSYDNEIKSLNPIGYWRLGENTGTTAYDEMGTFNGTYQQSPQLGVGGLLINDTNDSISINGTNQYISLAPTTEDLSSPVSVMMLCNLDSTKTSSSTLMELNGMFGGKRIDVSNGIISIYSVNESAVTTTMIFDQTVHLCCVWDLPNNMRYIYINGVEVVNGSVNSTSGQYSPGFNIGSHTQNSYYTKGILDEVALYDKALSPSEINKLYQISLIGKTTITPQYTPYEDIVNGLTPLAYYRMNDQNVAIAIDETGNYHGTYENEPILGETSLLTNDSNTAVKFNGVDQYVNCGNIPISGVSQSFSFLINTTENNIRHALSKWDNETGGNNSYLFEIKNDAIKMLISSTGSDVIEAQGTIIINDGQIHHIVGIFESSTKLAIYVDSVLDIEITTGIPISIHNGNLDIWLSALNDSPDYFLSGTLDEVCIFEKSLTYNEVQSLYQSSKNLAGGHGTPVYDLDRMTIGSDSQGNVLGQIASPTWVDDICFYHKALSQVRRDYHYQYFVNKKETLIGDL